MLKTKNHFRNTYEVVENTIFLKKNGLSSGEKKILAKLCHTMENDRDLERIYKSL